jgi:hypothetical protein
MHDGFAVPCCCVWPCTSVKSIFHIDPTIQQQRSWGSILEFANTLPADREIFARFQSLGDNCEFGLVQRRSGIEPLDLLRFAPFRGDTSTLIFQLVDALKRGFDGLGDPDNVVCVPDVAPQPREYLIHETKWNLQYHSGCYEGEMSEAELRLKQTELLRFKRRELLADLNDAKAIFVWKSNMPTELQAVCALVDELRRRGPNLLLWVKEAEQEHPPGSIRFLSEGLLEGRISRFARYGYVQDADSTSWYLMCRNALVWAERLRELNGWSHDVEKT